MIGIYGGTFNPVHYGHLRTALEITQAFQLEQLRMIPCHLPPHRQVPDVSAETRLQMLRLAVADTPGLQLDRRELDRAGPSYMVDTLQSLRAEFPQTSLLLIMGADAFAGLSNWHCWQQLPELAHIVVMTRPGFSHPALSEFWQARHCTDKAQLATQAAGYLMFETVSQLEISATYIRQIIAAGGNPQFLLPDAVLAFIKQHQLYQTA